MQPLLQPLGTSKWHPDIHKGSHHKKRQYLFLDLHEVHQEDLAQLIFALVGKSYQSHLQKWPRKYQIQYLLVIKGSINNFKSKCFS
jgi:hypothetical protein